MIDITITQHDTVQTVTLVGDLDIAASSKVESNLAPVLERTDCDVVIDCTQLNYISSSGLRILLNLYKHLRAHGHTATLKGMNAEVEEVLNISGFLDLFTIEK